MAHRDTNTVPRHGGIIRGSVQLHADSNTGEQHTLADEQCTVGSEVQQLFLLSTGIACDLDMWKQTMVNNQSSARGMVWQQVAVS